MKRLPIFVTVGLESSDFEAGLSGRGDDAPPIFSQGAQSRLILPIGSIALPFDPQAVERLSLIADAFFQDRKLREPADAFERIVAGPARGFAKDLGLPITYMAYQKADFKADCEEDLPAIEICCAFVDDALDGASLPARAEAFGALLGEHCRGLLIQSAAELGPSVDAAPADWRPLAWMRFDFVGQDEDFSSWSAGMQHAAALWESSDLASASASPAPPSRTPSL